MLWYSSGKPWTTVAVLQLWEQGRLGLDDLVADYVDGWGDGKERATIRHVLTHTGGFPMAERSDYDADVSFDEALAAVVATPAVWEPGTKAGYHPGSGWRVLGAIVERIDGRRIDRYLRDEIAAPLGLDDCHLGIPLEAQRAYGDRIVPVDWTGHRYPSLVDGGIQMVPYRIDEVHNEPWHIAKVEPGGGMRGPARAARSVLRVAARLRARAARRAHRRGDARGAPVGRARTRRSGRSRRGASASRSTSPAAPGGAPSGTAAWRRHGPRRPRARPRDGRRRQRARELLRRRAARPRGHRRGVRGVRRRRWRRTRRPLESAKQALGFST